MKAIGMFGRAEHPSEGSYKTIRSPVSFSKAAFRIRRHAPRLGEHTTEILEELGVKLKVDLRNQHARASDLDV
jgi:crotonobetainyl-CoA:carnitine CoA-transferase CaiB-like acyl-CoA transferase